RLAGNGAALLDEPRPATLATMAGFELAPVPKELHAARVTAPPTIDGVIDDAWATATPLRFATDWAGRATPIATTVRVLWSERGLYLLWELESAGLATDQARPVADERIDLYREDCIELFVAPDPAYRTRYFEIEVGPFGHYYDLAIDRAAKRNDAAWSGALRIGTTRDAEQRRAIIELAIEAPDLVAALQVGAKLPVGLYRMEGATRRQYLAAFPTYTPKPSFHVPAAFGSLLLDP
ncbi:MAG: carbohydrate-binding family 9-like protein, partial [Kofleriaceae bacterium]